MISYFFSDGVTGLAVAMPIGAVGSYLVGLAARERTATAVAAALGIASVDGAYAFWLRSAEPACRRCSTGSLAG